MVQHSGQGAVSDRRRMVRFLVVGLSGTLVDMGVFALLVLLHVPALTANVTSYSLGIVNNFWWNRAWTYRDIRVKSWQVQFGQFALVSLIGLALNTALVLGVSRLLASFLAGNWATLLAKVLATAVVVGWNWIANRHWTFRAQAG